MIALLFMLLALSLAIVAEACRNYYLIEIRKTSPRHWIRGIISGVGIGLWVLIGHLVFGMNTLWMLFVGFFYGMPLFDLSLNILRKKPWYYLDDPSDKEEDSVLDGYKSRIPGYWYWVILFAIGSVSMFLYYGYCSYWEVNNFRCEQPGW